MVLVFYTLNLKLKLKFIIKLIQFSFFSINVQSKKIVIDNEFCLENCTI